MNARILLRGGGDLASGVALRLQRAGIKVVITELREPLAVRRSVAFSEAIYDDQVAIEGIIARRTAPASIADILADNEIPVLVDPNLEKLEPREFAALVDGRLLKESPAGFAHDAPLLIGLGPGYHAGRNCHAAVETRRSHSLGRVYWSGSTQVDSGQPEGDARRVLRAPTDGRLFGLANIGDRLVDGQPIAEVNGEIIHAPFAGVLRGLIRPGIEVRRGMKIGDVDPRNDPAICFQVSDKSLSVAGGVLEAILTKPEIRTTLWGT